MNARLYGLRLFRLPLFLAALILVLNAAPGSAYAFSGAGSGTADDPYIITTPAQLDEMRNDRGAYYKLGNDIDMSGWGDFLPIGWVEGDPVGPYAFLGVLDGDYYTISNLTIDHPDKDFVGLFASLGSTPYPHNKVMNLRLTNVTVVGKGKVGGLVGRLRYGATVERVFVDGNVQGVDWVGGLVGDFGSAGTPATVIECVSKAAVTATGATYAGGLSGSVSRDAAKGPYVVTDSYATGQVSAGASGAGGLAGIAEGIIRRCYSSGQVTGNPPGGLVGVDWGGTAESSYWNNSTGTSALGTGKSTAEMKQQATYVGWDFNNVWAINAGVSFPYLRWETRPVMRGSVSISGIAKCGQTLTASTSLTYTAAAPGNVVTYQWKRDGVVISEGTGNTTYLVGEDDIGKKITLVVTADGDHAQGRVVSPATAAVLKADGPAIPAAPSVSSKAHRSVTLAAVAGGEYRMDSGDWQDNNVFTGLIPSTAYTFTVRVKETPTQYASAESDATVVTTDAPPVMGGSVTISGDLKYDSTITANTSGITYSPDTSSGNVLSYQWKRGGSPIEGATSSTYTLVQADIGQTITVTVTADGVNARDSVTSEESDPVTKADSSAPATLAMASRTHKSVTLNSNAAWEYRMGAMGDWQPSNVFESLEPSTQYSFYARRKETDTHFASPPSAELQVTTKAPPEMVGAVTISGVRQYGHELTAVTTAITYAPNESSGNVFSYQWKRGGSSIDGATASTYTLVQADIGQTISVTVTADGVNAQGSVTGVAASIIEKADVAAPNAPTLESKQHRTVTLADTDDSLEYRRGSGSWQDGGTFTLLTPSTAYTFTARVKETDTHKASPASAGLVVTTDAAPIMSGTVSIAGDLKYNSVLTATATVEYTPNTSVGNTLSYQWKRGGSDIGGATGSTYTLVQSDIGQIISVTVSADGINAQGNLSAAATDVVEKMDGPAKPLAPTYTDLTFRSVTLAADAAYEFSRGDVDGNGEDDWQGGVNGHVFTGLMPETQYTFRARVKETATQKASLASDPLTVTTRVKPVLCGTVTIGGVLQYGQTLTADVTGTSYTPGTIDDHPTYRWRRGDSDIAGPEGGGSTYTLTEEDIGQQISVRYSADGDNADGFVQSVPTAAIEKADKGAPGAAPVLASRTFNSVTLVANALYQFSRGDVDGDGDADWQDGPAFTGLLPNTEYSFVARFKETNTHKTSPASPALTVSTAYDLDAPTWAADSELRAPQVRATWVSLEWGSATDNVAVTAFRVYANDTLIETTAAASYQVRHLRPLTSYTFRVEAGDAANNWSEDGPELTIETKAPQEDPTPGYLGTDVSVNLEYWTGSSNIEVKCPEGAESYTLRLDGRSLSSPSGSAKLVASTGFATVAIPSSMLSGTDISGAELVKVTVGLGDKEVLPVEVKESIGDRSLIRLSLDVAGQRAAWSNPDAPVTVSIPYTPKPEELLNPEAITVWYIDGSGGVVAVPSGRYDAATDSVVFTTTHFSDYAVVFVEKTFDDLQGVPWAKREVEVLAAKGIVKGTTGSTFKPDAEVSRADFLLMLVRTLGLTAREIGTFHDVLPSDYFHNAVGVAKSLGITNGVDGERFDPMSSISRQDMMVLAARALSRSGRMSMQSSAASTVLNGFSDVSSIDSYALDSIASLVQSGLIAGDGGRINPTGFTSRAEAAVFLYRVYNMR